MKYLSIVYCRQKDVHLPRNVISSLFNLCNFYWFHNFHVLSDFANLLTIFVITSRKMCLANRWLEVLWGAHRL